EEAGLLAKVEVYTGEVPADRQHFPSCWELAASRGAVVADYLASHGAEPDRVAVSGYGIAKPAKTGQRGRGTSAGSVEVTLTYHEG
ncbi:MAG TPA: OmpA family protein, partial [Syntrophales bacterium]|nr:OmpA family protein [Syntrophales bacterium]